VPTTGKSAVVRCLRSVLMAGRRGELPHLTFARALGVTASSVRMYLWRWVAGQPAALATDTN
jgi:hypothetical protein